MRFIELYEDSYKRPESNKHFDRNQLPQIRRNHVKDSPFNYKEGTLSLDKIKPVQSQRVQGLSKKAQDVFKNKEDRPFIIDKNNYLINGHHRYDAANMLGIKKVPAIMIDADIEDVMNHFAHTTSDTEVMPEHYFKSLYEKKLKAISETIEAAQDMSALLKGIEADLKQREKDLKKLPKKSIYKEEDDDDIVEYYDEIHPVVIKAWKSVYPNVPLKAIDDEDMYMQYTTADEYEHHGGNGKDFYLSLGVQYVGYEEPPMGYVNVGDAYAGNYKGVVAKIIASLFEWLEQKHPNMGVRELGIHMNRNVLAWTAIAKKVGAQIEKRGYYENIAEGKKHPDWYTHEELALIVQRYIGNNMSKAFEFRLLKDKLLTQNTDTLPKEYMASDIHKLDKEFINQWLKRHKVPVKVMQVDEFDDGDAAYKLLMRTTHPQYKDGKRIVDEK